MASKSLKLQDVNNEMDLYQYIVSNVEARIGLFCGAGTSFNSGIPLALQIVDYVTNKYGYSEYFEILEKSKFQFEYFMELLLEYCDKEKIFEIFKHGIPNHFHIHLTEMIKCKYVKNIITVNFDSLIEKELTNQNVNYTESFNYNDLENLKISNNPNDIVNIIKLHGSIEETQSISISMTEIMNRKKMEQRKLILERFFNNSSHNLIIIYGYSCSDVIDVNPVIENINSNNTILFINHTNDKDIFIIRDLKTKNSIFKNFQGKYIECNTCLFVINLHKKLFNKKLSPLKHSFQWEENIEKSIDGLSKSTMGHILGKIFFSISDFTNSYNVYNYALKHSRNDYNKAILYLDMMESGNSLKNIGIDELYKAGKISNQYFRKLYYDHIGEICNHTGHLKRKEKLFKEAISKYEEGKLFYKLSKNEYKISQMSHNIAEVNMKIFLDDPFYTKENLLECLKIFISCLVPFKKESNPLNETILYYNIGKCYFYLIKFEEPFKDKAIIFLKESRRLSISINDNVGIEKSESFLSKLREQLSSNLR